MSRVWVSYLFYFNARGPNLAAPLSFLLFPNRPYHFAFEREQAAALSDPVNNCLSHTNGGHKQPVTLGVFTCVADARFLLRAMIVIRKRTKGLGQLLVLDVGSPPASDAGGITAGRGWDLRKTKSTQVGGITSLKRPILLLLWWV